MRQVLCVRSQSVAASGATYFTELTGSPTSGGGGEFDVKAPWPTDGTFSGFKVHVGAAPGAGKNWVFTVRKNAVDTPVTVTIPDTATSGSDITNSFTVAPGDLLSVKCAPSGTPAALVDLFFAITFESTTANESGHAWGPQASAVGTNRNALFTSTGLAWTTNAGSTVESVAACAGAITALYVHIPFDSADAAGEIYFHIYKNGVLQDGAGGTVDTKVTFGNADWPSTPTKSSTFSLSVSPGDTFYIERTNTASNTFAAGTGIGVRFVATTDHQSNFFGIATGDMSNSAATFQKSADAASAGWVATEADRLVHAGITSFGLSKPQYVLQGSPGSSKSYTFDARKNSASPAGTPTVVIADAATAGADTSSNSVSLADGDTFTFRSVPSGTPTARAASWAYIQTVAPPQIRGSAVFGESTTVTSSRSFAVGLDGNTNIHSEAGKAKFFGNHAVTGYQELIEMTAPAGVANTARLYAVDNGSGKTRLMVIFGSGAAIQLSIEP